MKPLVDMARMAAEVAVVAEHGPEARVEDFRVDAVELDGDPELPDARVQASVRVSRRLDAVNVSFTVA